MAKSIGTLFVEYRATADKYLADLKQMAKDSKEFERTIAPLKNQLLSIGTGMSVVGGLVTTAFIGMAKQAANYGDAIRDASIRTGVSTESLSGLKFAAEQTGTSFETVNSSLTRLSRNALTAAEGSKKTSAAFTALGISVKDSSGHLKNQDALLGEVADKFSKMKDGTEKAAIAVQLFGRSGVQMTEFLNQGSAGLEEFNKRAEEMGLIVGKDAAGAADAFNDSLNALSNAQLGLSNTIAQAVLPMLTKMVDLVTGVVIEFRKFTAAHPELIRVTLALGAALTGAGGLLLGLAGVLAILPQLTIAFGYLTGPIGVAVLAVGAFVSAMYAFPKFRGVVVDTLKNVTGLFALLGSQIGSIGSALLQLATGQFKAAFDTIRTSGTKSLDDMVRSLDAFDGALGGIHNALNFTAPAFKEARISADEFGISLDTTGDKASKAAEKIRSLITQNNAFIRQHLSDVEEQGRKWIDVMSDAYSKELGVFIKSRQTILDVQDKNRGQLQDMLEKQVEQNNKWIGVMSDDYSKGLGKDIDAKEKAIDAIDKANEKAAEEAKKRYEDAVNSVKNSAGKIFDDMFIKGESVFKSLKNLLKGGALSLGRSIFEDVTGALLGPVKLAFDNFFKGLISGPLESLGRSLSKALTGFGADKALGSVLNKAGGIIPIVGNTVGGAGAAFVGPQLAGSLGGAGAAAGGAASSVASTAISVFTAAFTGIASTLVTAFAGRGRQQRTEENTRESRDWLELQTNAWNPLFNQMVYYQKGIYEFFSGSAPSTISGNGRVGPGHVAGLQTASSIGTINAPFNFNPTLTFNVQGGDRSELTIRDEMDQFMTVFETGVRGYRERLMQIVRDSFQAPESTPVPTNS